MMSMAQTSCVACEPASVMSATMAASSLATLIEDTTLPSVSTMHAQ
jgi:hypothetical protein